MHSGTPGLGAAGVFMWTSHYDDISESPNFNLPGVYPAIVPYRRRVPGALPLTGRANAPRIAGSRTGAPRRLFISYIGRGSLIL